MLVSRLTLAILIQQAPIFGKSFINNEVQMQQSIDIKVPVQLGVMSRCPDALFCESVFDRVLPKIAAKVDFSLIYIAK